MESYEFLAVRKAPRSDPAVQEFQFVNVTSPPELDELARMTVRVHSLRDFHRRKRGQLALNQKSIKSPGKEMRGTNKLQRLENETPTLQRIRHLQNESVQSQPGPENLRSGSLETRAAPSSPTSGSVSGNEKDGAPMRGVLVSPGVDPLTLHSQYRVSSAHAIMSGRILTDLKKLGHDLGTGNLDPFNTLPLAQTARVRVLLHGSTCFLNNLIHMSPEKRVDEGWLSSLLIPFTQTLRQGLFLT
jgi:hypothetical protein